MNNIVPKCLIAGCPTIATIRGLCRKHYAQYQSARQQGKTTEAAEMEAGRLAPAKPRSIKNFSNM